MLESPYVERRRVLSGLGLRGRRWRVPAHVVGRGVRAWEAVVATGGEGVVAKRLDSPYVPGRSPLWRKTKRVETLDVVVGGWVPGRGFPGRAARRGAGRPGRTRGVAPAGVGRPGALRPRTRELAGYLEVVAADVSPFSGPVDVPGARWVQPRLVAEITISSWTAAGRLRHPVWVRLRPDLTRLD